MTAVVAALPRDGDLGARFLILYSTTDGQTRRICDALRRALEAEGHAVTMADIEADPLPDLAPFDKCVIGARIRYGRHSRRVIEFVRGHMEQLRDRRSAFFSVNIVARKAGKNRPETNPYVRKFLRQTAWQPARVAVFAGRLDYPRYRFWDRLIIRFIMLITKGPTDPRTVVEFTDWRQVEAFALDLSRM